MVSLVKIWLLGSGCQKHQGSGKKEIEYLEDPYRGKVWGGSKNVRHPLTHPRAEWPLGTELRDCLRRRSACGLI